MSQQILKCDSGRRPTKASSKYCAISFYIDVKTVNTGHESFPVNIHIAGGTMASLQRPCSTFIVASLHSNECSIIAEQNSINFKHKICRIYIHTQMFTLNNISSIMVRSRPAMKCNGGIVGWGMPKKLPSSQTKALLLT